MITEPMSAERLEQIHRGAVSGGCVNARWSAQAVGELLAEVHRLKRVLSECRLFVESVQTDERTIEANLWRGEWPGRLIRRIDGEI